MAENPIYFYSKTDSYYQFSNFYQAPINLDGYTWPTTEHYFQAQKFVFDPTHFQNVLQAPKPRDAFSYAQSHKASVRPDWQQIKDGIMMKACTAKFEQHADLSALLLSTDNRPLYEHTRNDSYWGDGGDGSGRNQLGITLMQVRQILRDKQNSS